jgi:hypothetical protein
MQRARIWIAVAAGLTCAMQVAGSSATAPSDTDKVAGQPDDPSELSGKFAEICGQTGSAGKLTGEQLRAKIRAAEQMSDRLSQHPDPKAKVYLFRLEQCSNFYQFMLDHLEITESE